MIAMVRHSTGASDPQSNKIPPSAKIDNVSKYEQFFGTTKVCIIFCKIGNRVPSGRRLGISR